MSSSTKLLSSSCSAKSTRSIDPAKSTGQAGSSTTVWPDGRGRTRRRRSRSTRGGADPRRRPGRRGTTPACRSSARRRAAGGRRGSPPGSRRSSLPSTSPRRSPGTGRQPAVELGVGHPRRRDPLAVEQLRLVDRPGPRPVEVRDRDDRDAVDDLEARARREAGPAGRAGEVGDDRLALPLDVVIAADVDLAGRVPRRAPRRSSRRAARGPASEPPCSRPRRRGRRRRAPSPSGRPRRPSRGCRRSARGSRRNRRRGGLRRRQFLVMGRSPDRWRRGRSRRAGIPGWHAARRP
jgi:hypothetical protein